jgi:hypothetical protein
MLLLGNSSALPFAPGRVLKMGGGGRLLLWVGGAPVAVVVF